MNLFVLDKELDVIAIVDTYTSFIWTDRYQEAGDFELCMPMDQILLSYIKRDHYLWRNDSEHVMIIESIKIESDSEDGDRAIITGRSLESILDRRVIWGLRNLSGDFQDAVKTLLEECIISPSKPERKIENFKFQATDDTRITDLSIDTQYTGDNLYEVICALCKERNIGFKVTLENKQFVFKLYSGDDRSYDQFQNPYVVFSSKFDNIIDSTYQESSEGLKNVTLVGGEGEGTERRYTAVGNIEGLERRELFTDARDISSDDDTDMTESFDFTQYPNEAFNYLSKTFVSSSYFNSCMTDVSEFAGRTISITIPKYNNSTGVAPTFATILVNSSKQYVSTLKVWDVYDEDTTVKTRGSLENYEIALPIDAKFIYTTMFNQTAIDNDGYYGEIDDFECTSIKVSNSEYITMLRQRGSEDLSANVETISFEGQAETTQMFKYGTDFFMGDIVNVLDNYGHDIKSRVVELITSENEDGSTTTYPTFATMDYSNPEEDLIPDDYTVLDYIQSTGTQYIDTLVKPNQDTRVVCDFELLESGKAYGVFGARIGYGSTAYDLFAYGMNSETSFQDDYNTAHNAHTNSKTNVLYRIDKNKNVTLLDDVEHTFSASTFQLDYTMYLFGVNTSGSPNNQLGSLRIYSCQIYSNTTLIRSFYPVRHRNGLIGLYDVVGQAFYGNSGTGVFIGSDEEEPSLLPDGYTQKTYIESSGTQYIDTLFKPNQDTRLTMDVEVLSQNSYPKALFGGRNGDTSTIDAFMCWILDVSNIRADYGNTSHSFSVSIPGRFAIEINKNSASVDSSSFMFSSSTFQSLYNLALFSQNDVGGIDTRMSSMRLYSCKIYDNGTLIRDFVPCTNPSGVAGLYDVAGKAFYTNAGTGTFTAG